MQKANEFLSRPDSILQAARRMIWIVIELIFKDKPTSGFHGKLRTGPVRIPQTTHPSRPLGSIISVSD